MVEAAQQGDVFYCHFGEPIKSRPVLVLSRGELNAARENVVVALVTRTVRGIPLEIPVGRGEGLPKEGVASLGDIHTVPKTFLSGKKGVISTEKRRRLLDGLRLIFAIP